MMLRMKSPKDNRLDAQDVHDQNMIFMAFNIIMASIYIKLHSVRVRVRVRRAKFLGVADKG